MSNYNIDWKTFEEPDVMMGTAFESVNYRPPLKRRKLVEEFEAMSLEEEGRSYYGDTRNIRDSNYLKSQYDCAFFKTGNRKRNTKEILKYKMDDFRELKHGLNEVEDEFTKKKYSPKLRNKRMEKSHHKNDSLVSSSQIKFENNVFQFINKTRSSFPKLYEKLIKVYESVISKNSYTTEDLYKLSDKDVSNMVNQASGQQVLDKFLKNLSSGTIQANSKIADETVVSMLRKLEQDFDMEQEEPNFTSCMDLDAPLAITGGSESRMDYYYVEPVSSCIIEEVD